MSINIRCKKCRGTNQLQAKVCKRCGESIGKERIYRIQVRVKGKWIVRQVGTLDEAKAVEVELKQQRIATATTVISPQDITFKDVWQAFYQSIKTRIKHPTFYESMWRVHIEPRFKDRELRSITAKDLVDFQEHLVNLQVPLAHNTKNKIRKNLSLSTICAVLKLVRRMYNYALTTELYDGKNPTRTMVLSRFDNKKTNVLTDEQRSSLLTVLNAWENRLPALALHMCLVTGKRTGEIFGLRWTDIDFERNTMSFLVKSLKVGERQVLPMSKAVRSILEEAKQHQHIKNCPLVFPNSNGDKIEYTSIWQRIRKKAGPPKDFRAHDLRHTFASVLASSGEIDIFTLQKLLGHKTTQMTNRYTHLMDRSLHRGTEVIDRVLGNGD